MRKENHSSSYENTVLRDRFSRVSPRFEESPANVLIFQKAITHLFAITERSQDTKRDYAHREFPYFLNFALRDDPYLRCAKMKFFFLQS